jgi:DNA-binding NarL/FixJ family response regulator
MSALRVLVADDHERLRQSIVRLLSSEFEVVGAVADGEELVRAALLLQPDVIVSDIAMPSMDGFAAQNRLLAAGFQKPFVFITMMNEQGIGSDGKEPPVGFVHKSDLPEELVFAIQAVAEGESYLSRFFRPD